MSDANIGKINRDLGVMSPRALACCIDEALGKDEIGPLVELNIGIARGKNELLKVDIDKLSSPVKRKLIQCNTDCGIWFKNYSKYIFELLCDAHFPWTSMGFIIPKEEVLLAANTKTFEVMESLEAFDYISEFYPEIMDEVKNRLLENDSQVYLKTYLGIFCNRWNSQDTKNAVKIIEKSPRIKCPSCATICDLQIKFSQIPEESFNKMISASLSNVWNKFNYESMKEEDRERFKKQYKLMIIKQGIPE